MTIWNRPAYEAGLLLDDRYCPGVLAARHGHLDDPHVAPLNALARRAAVTHREAVPAFDPASGGVHARLLLLLQDPSRRAAEGSRIISQHNNDPTARNLLVACEQAGLAYERTVLWNVVPWWVADPAAGRRTIPGEARRARPYVHELVGLLPCLETVVLLGRHAATAWDAAGLPPQDVDRVRILRAPHPSPQAWNNRDARTGRPHRDLVVEALARAAGG